MFLDSVSAVWDISEPSTQTETLSDFALTFINFCSVVTGKEIPFGSEHYFNPSNLALSNFAISEVEKALKKSRINSENAKKKTSKPTDKTTTKKLNK